jgi:hypothetical protein
MSTLEQIAYFKGRRDEVPNQQLAKELALTKDTTGIKQIAENVGNGNKNIRSDCLKVLYEIGYIDPTLIADHVGVFLKLLRCKDNRMVWGAMIALASIANLRPQEIWACIEDVLQVTANGTVITKVWGIRALAKVAGSDPVYKQKIFPFLIEQISICIPRDVPTHAESIICAVDRENNAELVALLESRKLELTPAQLVRYKKVLKQMDGI